MGTSFDFLGEASHPDSDLVDKKYINNRKYLINVMEKYGFRVLSTEWWHFTYIN
jgi:D-alanyl-D-alanine dipeptidase